MTQTVTTDSNGIPLYVTDDTPATPRAPGASDVLNGWTGTFETADGTYTVVDGLITGFTEAP